MQQSWFCINGLPPTLLSFQLWLKYSKLIEVWHLPYANTYHMFSLDKVIIWQSSHSSPTDCWSGMEMIWFHTINIICFIMLAYLLFIMQLRAGSLCSSVPVYDINCLSASLICMRYFGFGLIPWDGSTLHAIGPMLWSCMFTRAHVHDKSLCSLIGISQICVSWLTWLCRMHDVLH